MTVTMTEAERLVSTTLGPNFGVIKLSGYWVIGRLNNGKWAGPAAQSKSLDKAIRDAGSK